MAYPKLPFSRGSLRRISVTPRNITSKIWRRAGIAALTDAGPRRTAAARPNGYHRPLKLEVIGGSAVGLGGIGSP